MAETQVGATSVSKEKHIGGNNHISKLTLSLSNQKKLYYHIIRACIHTLISIETDGYKRLKLLIIFVAELLS